jgi:hypothetical protein
MDLHPTIRLHTLEDNILHYFFVLGFMLLQFLPYELLMRFIY